MNDDNLAKHAKKFLHFPDALENILILHLPFVFTLSPDSTHSVMEMSTAGTRAATT